MKAIQNAESPIERSRQLQSLSILPAVPELHVEQRKDLYLLISPRGPRFCVVTKPVAIFVELCDGQRTLSDIFTIMRQYIPTLNMDDLLSSIEAMYEARFFEQNPFLPIGVLQNFEMNITDRCNLRCPFCYYDAKTPLNPTPREELDADQLIRVAGEAIDINQDVKIVLTGGEPLIRKDIREITQGIAQQNAGFIEILTNGTLLTKEMVAWMSEISSLRVQMSIDSLVPEENAITRGKGSLEKCLTAMDWLNGAGVPLTISSTLTSVNYRNVWKLRKYCKDRNTDFRHTLFFSVGARSKQNELNLKLSTENLWEVYDSALRNVGRDILQKEHLDQILVEYPRTSCGLGYGTVALHADGTLTPCTHLNNPEMALGNVCASSLRELLEEGSKRFGDVSVDNMPDAPCPQCHVRYWCTGGCKAQAYNTYGSMQVPAKSCPSLKTILTESMWCYCLDKQYFDYFRPSVPLSEIGEQL